MKAVCLLLCLALAQGHIFSRQRYPMGDLIVQPLDYIDQEQYPRNVQYQQPMEDQNSQLKEIQYQQQKQQREQQYSRQQKEHQNSQEQKEQQYSQKQKEQQYSQKQKEQQYSQKQKEQQYSQNHKEQQNSQENQQQNAQQNQQYPHQYQQQSSEEYTQQMQRLVQQHQNNKLRYQRNQSTQNSDSTSNESNSREKNSIDKFVAPRYADVQNLNAERNNEIKSYGDVISWNGVQIATGPKSRVNKKDIEKIFGEAHKTIKHVSAENKKIFHDAVEAAAQNNNEDMHLNATQLLQKNNYEVEEHTVKTDDGYYLTLFRIPAKDQTLVQQKPVVFLMHGLLGSADDWLLMGPGKSLAYLLADAGYEVWLGNARGSKYSRHHVSKHPAQSDFWQFGTDEIALHDLPAMIDYVLKTSNQQKLYYVGHSQGTTAYFALAATRPEYNNKIIMMYALSPMVYMANARSPMLRMIAPTSPFHSRLHKELGHGRFKPSKELVQTIGGAMCEKEIGCKKVCSNVNFVMSGVNVDGMDVKLIPAITSHLPAGASTRQIKQYAQGVASKEFTKYDFGAEMNEKVYGDRQPPKYDLQKVQTPVTLYYSEEDWLAHPKDVQRLENELANVKESHKVPVDHFTHMDFQFSRDVPQAVYMRLIDSIEKHSQRNYVY